MPSRSRNPDGWDFRGEPGRRSIVPDFRYGSWPVVPGEVRGRSAFHPSAVVAQSVLQGRFGANSGLSGPALTDHRWQFDGGRRNRMTRVSGTVRLTASLRSI